MKTREELLSGVVKVNKHEREDLKATAQGDEAKVRDDASARADQQAGERGTHGPSSTPVVQGVEGSLEEVLAHRKAQGTARVAVLTSEIEERISARQQLKKELKAIDKVLEEL